MAIVLFHPGPGPEAAAQNRCSHYLQLTVLESLLVMVDVWLAVHSAT